MTGIATPNSPRVLAPGEPGSTCATCKHYAVTVTQFADTPEKLRFICIAEPPTVQTFPRRVKDGTIVGIDRITSYPEPEPFHSCGKYAQKLLVAREMPAF